MKQPKINIENFGLKPITSLNWNIDGKISVIQVDFMGKHKELMPMYDIDDTGIFSNIHGNLKGTIVIE